MNDLRPKNLDEIIGQKTVVERLGISVKSSVDRNEAMPHMLFDGPPGLGKTSLAMALAESRNVPIKVANGGNIRTVKDILPYLVNVEESSIVFIDEIHRLPVAIEELLYPVMEDFRLDVGNESKLSMELDRFTLIGATTEAGALARPFHDRFTYQFQLELYGVDDLTEIVSKSATGLELTIDPTAAKNVALRSRGTPRVANSMITWIRDFAQAKGSRSVSNAMVDDAMRMIGVERNGVTRRDRAYLAVLKRATRPMGLRSLVDATNIDADTIQGVIEPFLLRHNVIERTSKGRVLV